MCVIVMVLIEWEFLMALLLKCVEKIVYVSGFRFEEQTEVGVKIDFYSCTIIESAIYWNSGTGFY